MGSTTIYRTQTNWIEFENVVPSSYQNDVSLFTFETFGSRIPEQCSLETCSV